ncbi:FkbM family methyltransferase [Fulvivirga sp. M361]|uniref:FkbM family methyltransferase n=1 Tax=Fulvivirga sp. M361 TaxID=2594266 RepID=UPI00117B8D45|nr:FkbM family methyltransferase [Fulvivirga sp. M361]TRX60868.1 FkbM family methyltransferase [Fulvivirga sp. M361]
MSKQKAYKDIYLKCKNKGIQPTHTAEVGVYLPETSNILDFINDGIRTTLVEPDPDTVKVINSYFYDLNNVTLYPVAAYYKNGTVSLYRRAASTFLGDSGPSPAMVNDRYETSDDDKFEVEAKMFSEIDDGTIDLLSVDIEGAEWYVIQHLVSRPMVISVETHGKYYINPKLKEIEDWMEQNGYIIWYKDRSDTVYIKKELHHPSVFENIKVGMFNIYLRLRRAKKIFKR